MTIPPSTQIDAYESAPAHIAAAIEGMSAEQLQQRPAHDAWSIHEVLMHLPWGMEKPI